MKKICISILLVLTLFVQCFTVCAVENTENIMPKTVGNWIDDAQAYEPPLVGTVFEISTANQLAWIAYMVNIKGSTFRDNTFELQNNIDLAGKQWTPIGGFNGTVTDETKALHGTFDGKGFQIQNLTVDVNRAYVGLFGCVYGSIKNLGIVNANVKGVNSVGGLVGSSGGSSSIYITNCYSTGTVSGNDDVGGLVGGHINSSDSNITNSYSTGTVSGNRSVGGLVGYGGSGNITNSYSTGTVSGTNKVGGLVGNCYYYNNAIVGYWNKEAVANGVGSGNTVNADIKIIGMTTAEMQSPNFVNKLNEHGRPDWAQWDYDREKTNNGYPILNYSVGTPSPAVFWRSNGQQPLLNVDTYEIKTPEELCWISEQSYNNNNFSGKTIKLINDIDLQGKQWVPIDEFRGNFNGNFKKIKNLTIGNKDYHPDCCANLDGGLFSSAYSTIKNIGMENVNIYVNGDYSNCGAITGDGNGTLLNSYSTGEICSYGSGYQLGAGGLLGGGDSSRTINNCYSTANVTSYNAAGGLAGYHWNRIDNSNSYATGNITGKTSVGGLLGYIEHGNNSLTNYWNINAIHTLEGFALPNSNKKGCGNQTDTTDPFGKTLEELKNQSTYVGWDFENVWAIEPNKNGGLPYLRGFDMSDAKVRGVELSTNALSLEVGNSRKLKATISPTNASNSLVNWKSSNDVVVSVGNTGEIVAIAPGRATITATTVDGGFTATCSVIVSIATPVVRDYQLSKISILDKNFNSSAIPTSGNFYVSADVTNNTTYRGPRKLYAIMYDIKGRYLGVKSESFYRSPGVTEKVYVLIDGMKNSDIASIKALMLVDLTNIEPLSNLSQL